MSWLSLAIAATVVNFVLAEVFDLFPWLARRMVRCAVRVLPPSERDRYEAEWLAELEALPGRHLPRLFYALGVLVTAPMTRAATRSGESPRRLDPQRLFDLAVVVPMLVVASPIFLLIALAILLSTPGPVLVRSIRVDPTGRQFELLKFSTPALVGDVLRSTALDELPQLINIVRGDMSLTGPRPVPAATAESDRLRSIFREGRGGRAGMVSWTALRGDQEGRQRDEDLAHLWSLRRGLHLLIATIPAAFKARE